MAILPLSYNWLVRSTFVGALMNGKRLSRSFTPVLNAPAES